jgi:hypothetical protein
MAEFKRGQYGWYYAGNWMKPIIGLVVFLIIASIMFKVIALVLPIAIVGALIFFGIQLFSPNGTDRARWEVWAERFGERAEHWAKQFERNVTGCSKGAQSTPESEAAQPRKRKNDEEVLDIEYEEVQAPGERGRAKRDLSDVEYL